MKQKENLHLEKKDHSMLVKEFKTYNKKCPSKSKKKEQCMRSYAKEDSRQKQKQTNKCPSKNSNA